MGSRATGVGSQSRRGRGPNPCPAGPDAGSEARSGPVRPGRKGSPTCGDPRSRRTPRARALGAPRTTPAGGELRRCSPGPGVSAARSGAKQLSPEPGGARSGAGTGAGRPHRAAAAGGRAVGSRAPPSRRPRGDPRQAQCRAPERGCSLGAPPPTPPQSPGPGGRGCGQGCQALLQAGQLQGEPWLRGDRSEGKLRRVEEDAGWAQSD